MLHTLETIINRADLPLIIKELNDYWANEAVKRKQFYDLVHENIKAEFINGEIIFHSPVRNRHWTACTRIGARLSIFVDDHQLGVVGIEKVMIRCNRNDYEPDVVFFAKDKAEKFTPEQLLFPPPDLAVEVLSDSTRATDYGIKMIDYAAHGVGEYWIVDADEKSIEQYLLLNAQYHLHRKYKDNDVLQSFAIQGFEADISNFFS